MPKFMLIMSCVYVYYVSYSCITKSIFHFIGSDGGGNGVSGVYIGIIIGVSIIVILMIIAMIIYCIYAINNGRV